LWTCPEGAATLAAARSLAVSGWLRPSDRVVLFNTGSAFKYVGEHRP
jgi:threonine synthase